MCAMPLYGAYQQTRGEPDLSTFDRSGWLSRWPDFFPRKHRERGLAYLIGMDLVVRHMDGSFTSYIVWDYGTLRQLMFDHNVDVYVHKFVGKNGIKWFGEIMDDDRNTINMANSSRTIVSIAMKGPRNRVCKILSTTTWGWRKDPTPDFLNSLQRVFDAFDYGVHPSPGSLGTNVIRGTLSETHTRYTRPGNMLRRELFTYGSGGRSDEYETPQEYDSAFQFDWDNHYATVAKDRGVPTARPQVVGLRGAWQPYDIIKEFATAFCQVRVTVPTTLDTAPFYIRHKDGLHWIMDPGVYEWWLWKEMIDCCVEAGCTVEVGYCYCWKELDYFLNPFIDGALEIRDEFKRKGMKLEAKMTKSCIVAAFGSFGMRPFVSRWFLRKGGSQGTSLS